GPGNFTSTAVQNASAAASSGISNPLHEPSFASSEVPGRWSGNGERTSSARPLVNAVRQTFLTGALPPFRTTSIERPIVLRGRSPADPALPEGSAESLPSPSDGQTSSAAGIAVMLSSACSARAGV